MFIVYLLYIIIILNMTVNLLRGDITTHTIGHKHKYIDRSIQSQINKIYALY